MRRSHVNLISGVLMACALAGAACSNSGGAPTASTVAPSAGNVVTAGTQVGTLPSVPAGWTPPATITPINPPPGMFQSTGAAPALPGAKVRVFFLGMQW